MADVAVIAGLAYHQPGMVTTHGKLAGYFLANKAGSTGDQQFHFFVTAIHSHNSQVGVGVIYVVTSLLIIAIYGELYKLRMI